MEALLAQDVTFVSDGGGRANAALRPIRGAEKVARLLLGLSRRQGPDVRTRLGRSNGAPAIILETSERLLGVFVLELSGGVATGFYLVLNPEKLQHLQPVEPPASTPA
jgi:RNA polymerase sigma-70 factor (ECF subfamily)